MDRQPENLVLPPDMVGSNGQSALPKTPTRSNASRWFGYDIFISFALGPPPRGTHSYASDLARRLRELDFTVFFSEDEMSPGEELDSNFRSNLHKSKALAVIVNRGTLKEPRWIRKEVEEYKAHCLGCPIILINVGGALQDPQFTEGAQEWLEFRNRIWLDETNEAIENGIATETVVNRLALAPSKTKSNVVWRRIIGSTVVILVSLVVGLGFLYNMANNQRKDALAGELVAIAENLAKVGPDQSLLLGLAARGISATARADAFIRFARGNYSYRNTLRGHEGWVTSAQFSSDGKTVLSASRDKTARLWDTASGRELRVLRGHARELTSAQFSADGKTVLTASEDKTARLWDAASGRELRVLRGDGSNVTSAQFSADGKTVLTASGDPTARLWDTASGRELQVLRGHERELTSAQFSTDGKTVLTASWDTTARLWRCDVCRPVDEMGAGLAKAVGRELSKEERRQFGVKDVTFFSLFSG